MAECGVWTIAFKNADGIAADELLHGLDPNMSILDVKRMLAESYPGQPPASAQKIVFAGRCVCAPRLCGPSVARPMLRAGACSGPAARIPGECAMLCSAWLSWCVCDIGLRPNLLCFHGEQAPERLRHARPCHFCEFRSVACPAGALQSLDRGRHGKVRK